MSPQPEASSTPVGRAPRAARVRDVLEEGGGAAEAEAHRGACGHVAPRKHPDERCAVTEGCKPASPRSQTHPLASEQIIHLTPFDQNPPSERGKRTLPIAEYAWRPRGWRLAI